MSSPPKPGWSLFGMRLPAFTEGSFAYNVSFTSGRSLVTILAQLVFTPIIVKLYDPEAYGAFGFIFSISTLLLSIATLQYQKAFFLAHEEKDIKDLRALSNALPFYFSMLLCIVLLIFRDPLLELSGMEMIGNGIFLIPLFVLVGGWSQTSQGMVAVRYRYKQGFIYGSAMIIGSKLGAVLYGLVLGSHYLGLALAELLNRTLQQLINARFILKDPFLHIEFFKLKGHTRIMRKYSGFPRYELPAVVLAGLSNQIPIFWIPQYFSLAHFGQFALAMSLLEMPMRFFGYSLSETFYQKAARTYQDQGKKALARITYRMIGTIALMCFGPLLIIGLFAETVFIWVFGPTWALAGTISSILSLYYFCRLITEPIASVLRVIGEQRNYFMFNGTFLLLRLLAVSVAILQGYDIIMSMVLYSLANTLGYIVLAVYIIRRISDHSSEEPQMT